MSFNACLFVIMFGIIGPGLAFTLAFLVREACRDREWGWFFVLFSGFLLWCSLVLWVGTNAATAIFNTDCQLEHVEEFETEGGVSI